LDKFHFNVGAILKNTIPSVDGRLEKL